MKTILIVDDSVTARNSLKQILRSISGGSNFTIIEAENGKMALSKVSNWLDVQMVITDIQMPEMNGFDFIKKLSGMPGAKDVPVIVVCGAESEAMDAWSLGASAGPQELLV